MGGFHGLRATQLSKLLEENSVGEAFNKDFLRELRDRRDKARGIYWKLWPLHALLVIALYSSQFGAEQTLKVLDLETKNFAEYKEFALIVAATVYLALSHLSIYEGYCTQILKVVLAKIIPSSANEFASLAYYEDEVLRLFSVEPPNAMQWTTFAKLSIVFPFLLNALSFFVIWIAWGALLLSVIIDAFLAPRLSPTLGFLAGTYATICYLGGFFAAVFVRLPLPSKNPVFYAKLAELEKLNPEEYKSFLRKRAETSTIQERRFFSAMALAVNFLIYVVFFYFSMGVEGFSSGDFLIGVTISSIIAGSISAYLAHEDYRSARARFFSRHGSSLDAYIKHFKPAMRLAALSGLLRAMIISFGCIYWAPILKFIWSTAAPALDSVWNLF